MSRAIDHLYETILAQRGADPSQSRTAKLFRDGLTKMAKKVSEEAVEVALDAVQGNHAAVVHESADLFYNLCVLWVQCGVHPEEIWAELNRREELMGIAEKLPKNMLAVIAQEDPAS
jgi:phosphoribosyl-ATP pyrophosphohydrolase